MSDQGTEGLSAENSSNVSDAGSRIPLDVRPQPPNDAPDHVLQSLVDLVNGSELEIGITLTGGGFLISGTLISGKSFFDGLADEMATSFEDESPKKAIRDYFERFGDIYTTIAKGSEHSLPIYIHLKNARHFHNSGKPIAANRGVYWRGRISQVVGFFMGTLSAD